MGWPDDPIRNGSISQPRCYSYVGRQYEHPGFQKVSIGDGCEYKGTAIHEMLHAVGFWHEQSRPDRNRYVKIIWENIKPGMSSNFNSYDITRVDDLNSPYDYKSVMHYGKLAFSKNNLPTIRTVINSNAQLGQRDGFSETDIYDVNALYECQGSSRSHGWSAWSPWSSCSEFCDSIRERHCTSKHIFRSKNCPQSDADGMQEQTKKCGAECLSPVDGHWGRWSGWSSCSRTCGYGNRIRTRLCDDPAPLRGGKNCEGSKSSEKKWCHIRFCPGDCNFNKDFCDWTQDTTSQNLWRKWSQGGFIYFNPTKPNSKAEMKSLAFPAIAADRTVCMKFFMIMRGEKFGTLSVYIKDLETGGRIILFQRSSKADKSIQPKINIKGNWPHGYKVVIEAVSGSQATNNVFGVDGITFTDGPC